MASLLEWPCVNESLLYIFLFCLLGFLGGSSLGLIRSCRVVSCRVGWISRCLCLCRIVLCLCCERERGVPHAERNV